MHCRFSSKTKQKISYTKFAKGKRKTHTHRHRHTCTHTHIHNQHFQGKRGSCNLQSYLSLLLCSWIENLTHVMLKHAIWLSSGTVVNGKSCFAFALFWGLLRRVVMGPGYGRPAGWPLLKGYWVAIGWVLTEDSWLQVLCPQVLRDLHWAMGGQQGGKVHREIGRQHTVSGGSCCMAPTSHYQIRMWTLYGNI